MLLQLGEAPASMPAPLGRYREWFERVWQGPLALVDGRPEARARARWPDARDYAGIVVTGSAASLAMAELEPWMDDAAELVRRAHDVGTPLLGVCFGHQLIGHAFGGRVVENPCGGEVGSREIELTDEGLRHPMFAGPAGLAGRLRANLTHRDIIDPTSCPPEVRVLAGNDAATLQAVAVGEHTWGVQFHPEFSRVIMAGYIEADHPELEPERAAELRAGAEDCPDAAGVMGRFKAMVSARS